MEYSLVLSIILELNNIELCITIWYIYTITTRRTPVSYTHLTLFFGFIIVIIASIIANACFLYILDNFGYFSWAFKCYVKTLELFYNIKDITFLKYWKVMLSDVAVIGSGMMILFAVFDWIPNGIMNVLGYKSQSTR